MEHPDLVIENPTLYTRFRHKLYNTINRVSVVYTQDITSSFIFHRRGSRDY